MALKIKQEHYNQIKEVFQTLDKDKLIAKKESLRADSRVKDIDKRFRWDLAHAILGSKYICDYLYPYLDDNQIDNALKHIVKELGLGEQQ